MKTRHATRNTPHAKRVAGGDLSAGQSVRHTKHIIQICAISTLAALMRLWKLGEWSLWTDELLTTLDAQRFPDFFPINPLSYIFVKLSIFLFGSSEWGVRFIPCLIGILTVPVLYFLVRAMYDSKVAFIAALFSALSPWHLFWSQNARSYIFTFLFSSIAAFLFYLALEEDRPILMVLSLISAVMLVMSHLLSAMMIPALAGYVLFLWFLPIENPPGLRIRNLAIFFAPFIAVSMLLLIPDVFQYLTSNWGHNVWSRSPIYVAFTLVYELTIPVFIAAFLSAVYGSCRAVGLSRRVTNRGSIFLACYAGIPFVLFLTSSVFMNVAGYYMFFTLPAFLTLASVGITKNKISKEFSLLSYLHLPRSPLKIGLLLIIILTLFSRDYLYFRAENGGRPKWKEAFKTVNQRMAPNDLIVIPIPKIAKYYLPATESVKLKEVIKDKKQFRNHLKSTNRNAWFVLDYPTISTIDQGLQFLRWLNNNTRFIKRYGCYARMKDRSIVIYKIVSIN